MISAAYLYLRVETKELREWSEDHQQVDLAGPFIGTLSPSISSDLVHSCCTGQIPQIRLFYSFAQRVEAWGLHAQRKTAEESGHLAALEHLSLFFNHPYLVSLVGDTVLPPAENKAPESGWEVRHEDESLPKVR